MRIYIDVVFVLNGIINYLLLSASARLLGAAGKRGRRILAALLGAAYASATFLPGLAFLAGNLWRIFAMAAMLLISFGCRRKTISLSVIFLALSMALGGLVMILSSVLGAQVWLLEGRAFYAVGFGTLVLTAGAMYLGAWLLLQGAMAHTAGGIVSARLELLGKSISLFLLRDTGNTLRDPFSGVAIPVVEQSTFAALLPEVGALPLENAPEAMAQLHSILPHISARLIPFRAVGTNRALLLAIRCDALTVEGKVKQGIYVAISPTVLSEHGDYVGLIGEGV